MQTVIMLAIGAAAGAASFRHVHDVAAAHGQPGWLAWADALILEAASVAAGLEIRRRKRLGKPFRFSAAVLTCAVALSLAAQVVHAEPSVIGWIAAALPALGFLAMVKMAMARADTSPVPDATAALVQRSWTVPDEQPLGQHRPGPGPRWHDRDRPGPSRPVPGRDRARPGRPSGGENPCRTRSHPQPHQPRGEATRGRASTVHHPPRPRSCACCAQSPRQTCTGAARKPRDRCEPVCQRPVSKHRH